MQRLHRDVACPPTWTHLSTVVKSSSRCSQSSSSAGAAIRSWLGLRLGGGLGFSRGRHSGEFGWLRRFVQLERVIEYGHAEFPEVAGVEIDGLASQNFILDEIQSRQFAVKCSRRSFSSAASAAVDEAPVLWLGCGSLLWSSPATDLPLLVEAEQSQIKPGQMKRPRNFKSSRPWFIGTFYLDFILRMKSWGNPFHTFKTPAANPLTICAELELSSADAS
jgi:hypothetical protein